MGELDSVAIVALERSSPGRETYSIGSPDHVLGRFFLPAARSRRPCLDAPNRGRGSQTFKSGTLRVIRNGSCTLRSFTILAAVARLGRNADEIARNGVLGR